jgi:hypothetical protein
MTHQNSEKRTFEKVMLSVVIISSQPSSRRIFYRQKTLKEILGREGAIRSDKDRGAALCSLARSVYFHLA